MSIERWIWIAIWMVVSIVREIKEDRKFRKETVPEQLILLLKQAHAGQPFNTRFKIAVTEKDREKLCYPLTPEQVEIIKATPYHKCQWKKFSYRVADHIFKGGILKGTVLATIRFQDDSRGIDIDYKDIPTRICLICDKPGMGYYIASVEYM